MLSRQKSNVSSSNGFRHVSRPLGPDEHLPRLPTLFEQVMACRFEAPQDEPEDAAGDEAWQDDDEEDAGDS